MSFMDAGNVAEALNYSLVMGAIIIPKHNHAHAIEIWAFLPISQLHGPSYTSRLSDLPINGDCRGRSVGCRKPISL